MKRLETRAEIIELLVITINHMKNSVHIQDYETSIRVSERLETLEWLLCTINGTKYV